MSLPIPIIDNIIEQVGKFIPDKTKKQEFEADFRQKALSGEIDLLTGQMEVNKIEASHKSVFVAGWRPFVGWIGGLGLAYTMFYGLLSALCLAWFGITLIPLDPMHYTVLMTILGGLLGLRSWDKKNGVSTENFSENFSPGDDEGDNKKGFFKRMFR